MSGSVQRGVADPVEYFLEDVTSHGRTERTRAAYERVLRSFEGFLDDAGGGPNGRVAGVDEATYRDCLAWVHELRGDHADSTVATYASYLHRFYSYMGQVGAFDENPMALVLEEMDERISTDPSRRDLSVAEMRGFVRAIAHPLHAAVVTTLLKTGMRVGECCNLDLRDLHLSGPDAGGQRGEARPALHGRPNSLYVAADPARGAVVNGERRTASNKRQRSTVIPVDEELEASLRRWLAIRPDPVSPADPLFLSTADSWGSRLTPDMVHHLVETHASRAGWHRRGGGAAENVTPHYFRHFFTTHLRDRTGDRGVVKYLRGDVADDVIDTYTHDWGDRVREVYEANIYSLA